jgi:hypothetical protein
VVEDYAKKLQDTYVFPAKGRLLADGLRAHLKRGDYAGLDERHHRPQRGPGYPSHWERTGVQPDVNVPDAQALDVALAQISKASSAR